MKITMPMQFISPTIIVPWQINVLEIAKLFKWPPKIFSPVMMTEQ